MVIIIKRSSDKEKIKALLEGLPRKGKFDAYKHCGVLKLKRSPIDIQKALRDEWE